MQQTACSNQKSEVRGQRSEVRRQTTDGRGKMTDDRSFKVVNIEQQNREPQNDEVITSIRLRRILRFKEAAAQTK